MKKIIAAALALFILLSACGKETVGTDYDFSPVIEKTVEQTIEAAPSPVHDSIYGEWSVINAARSGVLVPQSWFDEYYANLSAALKEADGVQRHEEHRIFPHHNRSFRYRKRPGKRRRVQPFFPLYDHG